MINNYKTVGRKINKLLFSPVFIYFEIWAFILFMFSLKIVEYPELSNGFYFVLSLNFIGLLFGALQAVFLRKGPSKAVILYETNNFFWWIKLNLYTLKKVYRFLCVMGLIGALFMYINVFTQVGIAQFFLQQQYVKASVVRSVIGTYLSMGAYIALPLSVCLDWEAKKLWKYSKLPLLLTALYSMSYWGRFPFLVAIVILLTSQLLFFLLNKQAKDFLRFRIVTMVKGVLYGTICFLVVFLFLSWTIELRVAEYGDEYDPYATYYHENTVTKLVEPVAYLFGSFRAITMTYSYFVASIPTLSYWASRDSEYGMGEASVPYLYRLMDTVGIIDAPVLVGDRVLGRGMQLPSFVGYLYIDFGWVGVLVLSYVMGLYMTLLYEDFFNKPNFGSLAYLSLAYVLVLFSPITNVVSQTMYIIILFGSVLLNSFFKRNTKKMLIKKSF